MRTILGAIGGASRHPWAPKIIYINLRGHIQTKWTVFELFPPSWTVLLNRLHWWSGHFTICTDQKLNLSKGPSSYTKYDTILELGNLEYMFSSWRLECAKTFMKKHNFLRSVDIHTRTACYTKGREVQVIFRCTFRYLGVLSSYLDAQILLKNSTIAVREIFICSKPHTHSHYSFTLLSWPLRL